MGLRKEVTEQEARAVWLQSHLSLCKHTQAHTCTATQTHRHTRTLQESSTHTETHIHAQTGLETQRHTHAITHTHKYKGTLRHVNTRCPHKHTPGLCGPPRTLCFCFFPASSVGILQRLDCRGPGRDSPTTKPTGPCLTLLSPRDETPREHCSPWAGAGLL